MSSAGAITYRIATAADAARMSESRRGDLDVGPADPRIAEYLDGHHHPRHAHAPRTAFVASHDDLVIGYIAGHLTDRLGCQGEVQYLFVAAPWRRRGIGQALLQRLAEWFAAQHAYRVCVDVNPASPQARPFYLACGAAPLTDGPWMGWSDIRIVVP